MFFRLLLGCVAVCALLPLAAQTATADSLPYYALPDIEVVGFSDDTVARRVAASISVLAGEAINQFGGESLLPALNRLAGVRFEQRSPGSYRISVRGSTLRSPFGVRNIKTYWNGIPLTQPGGDTPLNFLDLNDIDRVEVIKGPAASLYGAGTAGTLLLSTDPAGAQARADVFGGSHGLRGARTRVREGEENAGVDLRLADVRTDGYRDHSAFARTTAQLSGRLPVGRSSELDLHLLYTNLSYEIPGGLNAEQYATDRVQARPGSAATNASINYDNVLTGATHRWERGRWSAATTLYGTFFYFDHPFNFDYKRETNLGGGGRALLDYRLPLGGSVLRLSAGTEQQWQFRMAQNFENADTRPGAVNFSDEIYSRQHLFFAQAVQDFGPWKLSLGLSRNGQSFRVDRTIDAEAPPALTETTTPTVYSPRGSVLYAPNEIHSFYASASHGFSPPTLTEFRTNEGSLNVGLRPESGVNYEAGYRYRSRLGRTELGLTAFYFQLDQTITSYRDARGTQLFRNAGSTDQQGLEAEYAHRISPALRWSGSLTYHRFRYGTYTQRDEDFSGNHLPGTAPFVTTQLLEVRLPRNFFTDLYWNFTDAIPLDNGNVVYGEAYHLVRATLGWRSPALRRQRFTAYATVNNLLDESLSLGNDLNPRFGGRYFQPAAGREFLLGLRWEFLR